MEYKTVPAKGSKLVPDRRSTHIKETDGGDRTASV